MEQLIRNKKVIYQVASLSSPIALVGVSLLISLQFQLGLILSVLIPLNVTLLCLIVWMFMEINQSKSIISNLKDNFAEQTNELRYFREDFHSTQAKLTKSHPIALPPGMFELYIDYKKLEIKHLADILLTIQKIYSLLYCISKGLCDEESSNINYNFDDIAEKAFRANPYDRFMIEAISSEESIKLRAKSGWLPSLSHDDEHFYIHLPNGVVVLIYLGGLLTAAATYGSYQYKEWLEIEKLLREKAISKKEEQKLDYELEELRRKLIDSSDPTKKMLEKYTNEFLGLTIGHHDIKGMTVRSQSIEDKGIKL